MKRGKLGAWLLVLGLLLGGGLLVVPQSATVQQFTIRILEAHGGKPVKNELLNVWVGRGLVIDSPDRGKVSPLYRTDSHGDAIVLVSPGADTLSLIVGTDIPCEPHSATDPDLNFSLDKILRYGAVSENVCGKARAKPEPGVLIVFVKHRPWWQIP